MRSLQATLLLLAVNTILMPMVCTADDPTTVAGDRFKQARDHTFQSFDAQAEQSWQKPYFFLQLFNIPLVRRTPLVKKLQQADVRAVFAGHYHRNSHGQAGTMEMITTGPVGKPLGKDPSGLRIVTVHEDHIRHQYYGLDDVPQTVELQSAQQPDQPTLCD